MVERKLNRGVCINEVTESSGPINEQGLAWLLDAAARVAPGAAPAFLGPVRTALGAQSARLFVADYSVRRLQQVDQYGAVAVPYEMSGTIAGRAFATGDTIISAGHPTVVSIPLADGAERMGLLELDYESWNGQLPFGWERVVALLVLVLVTKSRYGDLWARARRSLALTGAAEIQWELLPPLSCSTDDVGVAGILEPAYEIGGDSFDYAVNGSRVDFTIVDAIGRGMSAVLMSTAAINSLRNSRRSGLDIENAYLRAGELIKTHFGHSYFVTGQFGSLDTVTGVLTWVNAGHVLPMLVRDGSYVGE
ncbi:MAG TPA: SpoIIE family protein phosphatase, partial [Ilumatobacteraceae bacterium]|nr:SpoIIE family protein phosphatase [Ilumatobacteraceae bacterium]